MKTAIAQFLRALGLLPPSPKELQNRKILAPGAILTPAFTLREEVPGPPVRVRVGTDSVLQCQIVFESAEGLVSIGERVHIGTSGLICRTSIVIGNDVFIAWGVTIYDHDSHSLHYRARQQDFLQELHALRQGKNPYLTKDWTLVKAAPISVGDLVWIGMNSIILKGVTIGTGAIVGAGSVVTKDVPAWTVVAGNPAREIRKLEPPV